MRPGPAAGKAAHEKRRPPTRDGQRSPHTKPAVVEALAVRHDRQDVVRTLIRLAVTGQVVESGGECALAAAGP
jgi:hypothetical protein